MAKETRKLALLHGKDSDKGPRIVIVSEGYRAAELDQFRFDADLAAQTILGTPPFRGVPICIARLDVASKDSSAFRSLAQREADTAFRARFDRDNPHLLLVNEKQVQATVRTALSARWHDYKIVVLVNAPERFGGGGRFLASTGGGASGIAVASNANGSETLMHELGHAFGLADEYAASPLMGHAPPNVATHPRQLPAFWSERLTPKVAIPTRSTGRDIVGVFQAAAGAPHYRPQYSCIMKTSSSLDRYCKVCAEWIETAFMAKTLERKAS